MVYLVNLSEDYIRKKNKWLIKIKEWADRYDDPGALELKLQEQSVEQTLSGSAQDTTHLARDH